MILRTLIALSLALSLTGCASFISKYSGAQPLGSNAGKRSFGQNIVDKSIERTVKINTFKLDTRFDYSRINVNSFHSIVLLTGQVPDEHLKQVIEDNVKSMREVEAVHNYITVGPNIDYKRILNDTKITAQAKAEILKSATLPSSKVDVTTENGVLYIMGRLSTDEINALHDVLQNVGGAESVITLVDNLDTVVTDAVVMHGASVSTQQVPVYNIDLSQEVEAGQTPLAVDPNQPPVVYEPTQP